MIPHPQQIILDLIDAVLKGGCTLTEEQCGLMGCDEDDCEECSLIVKLRIQREYIATHSNATDFLTDAYRNGYIDGQIAGNTEGRRNSLNELKAWCVQMKCNGCPYGGVLFHKMNELRTSRTGAKGGE